MYEFLEAISPLLWSMVFVLVIHRERRMSEALNRLAAEVAALDTVIDSAATTIKGLAQQIRDSLTDTGALQRLADDLDSHAVALSAAIAESTTAVTGPVPPVQEPEPVDPVATDPVTTDPAPADTGDGSGEASTPGEESTPGETEDPTTGDDSTAG